MNITKRVKTIVSVSTLCAVMAFSSIANAKVSANDMEVDSPKHHQKRAGHSEKKMIKQMIKLLSLSEEQQASIKAIKMHTKEQSGTLRDSMKQFKGAEKQLLQAEKFDEQAYIALHSEYQQTFAEMALTRAKSKHAVFNVLTVEQQEKWLQTMEKRKGEFNKKRG